MYVQLYAILYLKESAMNAVNYSDLRRNLKTYLDKVYDDQETIIVARRNNENVVLISVDEYNSLLETNYLLSTEANANHLTDSLQAARAGALSERQLIDE